MTKQEFKEEGERLFKRIMNEPIMAIEEILYNKKQIKGYKEYKEAKEEKRKQLNAFLNRKNRRR